MSEGGRKKDENYANTSSMKETKGTTERLENRGPHVSCAWTLLTPVGAGWLGRVSGTRVAVSDPSQDGSSRVSRQQDG